MSQAFLRREEDLLREIKALTDQLAKAQEGLLPPESEQGLQTIQTERFLEGGEQETGQQQEQEAEMIEQTMEASRYALLEDELRLQIDAENDEVLKENLKWEKQIIHSTNNEFFKFGDTYKTFHTPTLPLPLLKLESAALEEKLKPECSEEELGGYAEIDLTQWRSPTLFKNQPSWRIRWFEKHPASINTYAQAPRELWINPVFCPCIRKHLWPQFLRFHNMRPSYLN